MVEYADCSMTEEEAKALRDFVERIGFVAIIQIVETRDQALNVRAALHKIGRSLEQVSFKK